jgi:adenylate cyclase
VIWVSDLRGFTTLSDHLTGANMIVLLNAYFETLAGAVLAHGGEVFFGNIGAPERLDFTVIGPAVNEASRVEALQKKLGRSILITEALARHLDHPLDHLGEHELRGVSLPVAVYSPRDNP